MRTPYLLDKLSFSRYNAYLLCSLEGRVVKVIFENILESMNKALISTDKKLIVNYINLAGEKLLGLGRSSVMGKNLDELFKSDPWIIELAHKTLNDGYIFNDYEGTIKKRFSGTSPVTVTTRLITTDKEDITGVLISLKDMGGINSFKIEEARKDRLALLGSFSATLAHEIKNPLFGIRGSAQLLNKNFETASRDDIKKYTGLIVDESDRLKNILDEMLNLTKPKKLILKKINIHEVLDKATALIGDGNIIIKNFDPSLPKVLADSAEITKVIINLIKNAIEASSESDGDKKQIRIVTEAVTDFRLISEEKTEKRFIAIKIIDKGCGMSPSVVEEIFTPFFTTKKSGSGLGLSLSHMIVKEHGGFLKINSKKNEGTEVALYLEVSEDE